MIGWRRLCAALFACVLASCGGGGGGDGDDLSVTSDRSSLTLAGVNGVMPPSQPITFTLSGGSGTYYGMAESDNDAFVASFEPVSDTVAEVRLSPGGSVPAGTQSSGQITFMLCSDEACQKKVWSKRIPYTMTMFSVDTEPVTIVGNEGAVSEPVSRAIEPPDTEGMLVFTLHDSTGITVEHTQPGQVDYIGSGVGLAEGSYTATLEVGVRVDGVVQSLTYGSTVSFTVGAGIVAPAVSAIDVTAGSVESGLIGTAPVRFAGTQSPAWTATSDSTWLVLDTASGSGAGEIAYHVDVQKLAGLANWGSYTAQVTIAASGLSDVSFPVTLNKKLAEVAMVTPSGAFAGQATTLRVSGRGLSGLSASDFRVGDVVPSAVVIESDTSARLQVPPLPAGSAPVRALNNLDDAGIPVAVVGVAPKGAYAAASVANNGEKRAAVFDASRQAVFATNVSQDTLVRYQLVNGQWTVSGLPLANIGLLALAPDRRTVYVVSGSQLVAVDPDTMKVRSRHDASRDLSGGFYFSQPLALTSNLRLWLGGDQWSGMGYFDLRDGTFGEFDTSAVGSLALYSPVFFAPANGLSLYVDNPMYLSPPLDNYWYDTATDTISQPSGQPIANGKVALDERGTVALIDNEALYRTSDWTLLGKARIAEDGSGSFGWDAVVSPDGRRIYRQVADSGAVVDHIDVFDATTVVGGESGFVKLGSIALPVKAVGCNVQDFDPCDGAGRLIIDPTGTVLFWVGGARMVVVPIPEGMSATTQNAQGAMAPRLRRAAPAPSRMH
jgi:hypothetical protein